MKTEKLDVTKLPYQNLEMKNASAIMDVVEHGECIDRMKIFIAYFNAIPNRIDEDRIDCRKANQWFLKNYETKIKKYHFRKRCFETKKEATLDDVFYFLYDDLIVYFDTNYSEAKFFFSKTKVSEVESVIQEIRKFKFKRKRSQPYISLVTQTNSGLDTVSAEIVKPKLRIDDNYNDDFKIIHQTILKRLNKKKDKGLVLLYGKPGTGKTSYIRYLLASLKKKVIFLPPNLAAQMTSPSLMNFLIENPNSVFVIEDAENIVIDREQSGSSAVSALLNLSDGLLSDCLNIQIVCSFNTDISKVDSALLRKGRLIAKYEFKELEIHKAQALSNKLGFRTFIHQPMTLTAIYNQEDRDFAEQPKRAKVGFKLNAA